MDEELFRHALLKLSRSGVILCKDCQQPAHIINQDDSAMTECRACQQRLPLSYIDLALLSGALLKYAVSDNYHETLPTLDISLDEARDIANDIVEWKEKINKQSLKSNLKVILGNRGK